MDEFVLYSGEGDKSQDRHYANSFAYTSSVHGAKQYNQYRQLYSHQNGTAVTGQGKESKLIVASKGKSLIEVFLYGKESSEQKIPAPEEIFCLDVCRSPQTNEPWLLVGGGKSGRLYVWELASGLLLSARECHFQKMTVVKCHGGFVVSGGADSRVVAWKTLDLVSAAEGAAVGSGDDDAATKKPYAVFTDHTLPVTDIIISTGTSVDLKVYSSSKDSTIRCHNLISRELLSTFVLPAPVTAFAADPAYRALYVGMEDGSIRNLPLYRANRTTHVLEAVGGLGSIVTVKPDTDLRETFAVHDVAVTQLEASFDGTLLVSGDIAGNIYVVDVATRQVQRKLKPVVGAVASIKLFTAPENDPSLDRQTNDKNLVRTIPVLKRVVADSKDLQKHEINVRLGPAGSTAASTASITTTFDLAGFLDTTRGQHRVFTNFTELNSDVITLNTEEEPEVENVDEDEDMEANTELRDAYDALKQKYEELYKEHIGLLGRQ